VVQASDPRPRQPLVAEAGRLGIDTEGLVALIRDASYGQEGRRI